MSGNYLEDINQFIKSLGPADQLIINRSEVGCVICNPNFVIDRNFNTKAKLVNHFKSQMHANNVMEAEARKEDHIKTVEDNLSKITEEIEDIERQLEEGVNSIKQHEEDTVAYKQMLLLKTVKQICDGKKKPDVTEASVEDIMDPDVYMCPKCQYKTMKLKRFKRHLHTHKDSACQLLLMKLA